VLSSLLVKDDASFKAWQEIAIVFVADTGTDQSRDCTLIHQGHCNSAGIVVNLFGEATV
jgi:hypothetical protein